MKDRLLLTTLGAGVANHILVLNRYEIQRHVLEVVSGSIAATLVLDTAIRIVTGWSMTKSAAITALIVAINVFGACTSTLIYRLFFNPLNRFPGPFGAQVARLLDVQESGQESRSLRSTGRPSWKVWQDRTKRRRKPLNHRLGLFRCVVRPKKQMRKAPVVRFP